jgi:glycosyltransferase involved in cell wall biosynthesis
MKYLLLFDTPAPWREKVFEQVHRHYGNDFHVAYYGRMEKRRLWTFAHGQHAKTFLKRISLNIKGRGERFINPGILPFLFRYRPKIVIIFGIFPTSFISFFIVKLIGGKIIHLSDSWIGRDINISWDQKIARKIIYKHFGDAYIGASKQTLNMYKHYNPEIDDKGLFLSALCADNDYFKQIIANKQIQRKYDIMFSGRIVELKNPMFIAEVAAGIKIKRGSCNLLIIGDGEKDLKSRMFKKLENDGVNYEFAGFIEHSLLPEYYLQARIMVLPTSCDCWGVVINEAFLCGVPVITTDKTAAAGELAINDRNSYILSLNVELWVDKICYLLDHKEEWNTFSKNSQIDIDQYNFEKASYGIVDAIKYVESKFDL